MLFLWLFFICVLQDSFSITVEIDGRIDLGPNWNYEYRVSKPKIQSQAKMQPLLRTLKPDTEKMIQELLSSKKEDNDTFILDEAPPIFDMKIDSENNSTRHNTNKTFVDDSKIKINSTIVGKSMDVSAEKDVLRDKRKTKKRRSTTDALDHDKIKLEDDLLHFTTKNAKKKRKKNQKSVTKFEDHDKSEEVKMRKVKDDTKVQEFLVHIFKQTLKVLDDIKTKTDDINLKRNLKSLKRTFEHKFGKFLTDTYNHTLRTNLGTQKIILNTIDTSHKMLQRLLNNLFSDMDREVLRSNMGTMNVFKKEIDREKELENKHACQKLNICRQNAEFSDFLSEIIIKILEADEMKIKQAADALTEVLKNTDLDDVLNYDLQMKTNKYIEEMEYWDTFRSRAMFVVLKNIIKNKNKPIVVMNPYDSYLANKTIAFQDIINYFDEKLPKSKYEHKWQQIKKDVNDWKEGKNNDIQGITEAFMKHLKENALDTMDYNSKKRFNKNVSILLSDDKT